MSKLPIRSSATSPTHPGAVLRDDVLPALRLSVAQAAEMLGISRQMLHGILTERYSVTPETAVRIGKLLGNGPELWLRMQQAHDVWHARQTLAAELEQIPTLRAA